MISHSHFALNTYSCVLCVGSKLASDFSLDPELSSGIEHHYLLPRASCVLPSGREPHANGGRPQASEESSTMLGTSWASLGEKADNRAQEGPSFLIIVSQTGSVEKFYTLAFQWLPLRNGPVEGCFLKSFSRRSVCFCFILLRRRPPSKSCSREASEL